MGEARGRGMPACQRRGGDFTAGNDDDDSGNGRRGKNHARFLPRVNESYSKNC